MCIYCVYIIISILIINYEKDQDDINPKIKRKGILIQICAMLCSALSIVMIKEILNTYKSDINSIIWMAVFRLLIGFIVSWIIFLSLKNTKKLFRPIKEQEIIIKIVVSSVFGTFIALGCWMLGQAYIEKLPLASIIGQTALIFIIFFSWIFLKEKITRIRIIASVFALLGVFLSNYF